MARPAGAISEREHLLAAAPAMGRGRYLAEHLANLPLGVERARATGLERSLCRREFRTGKKRGACVGKTKRGKGTKWMVVVDGEGIPLGSHLASASPAEVTLLEETLSKLLLPHTPWHLIADRAYDSDKLRERLHTRHIQLICPHRRGRVRPPTQDGRPLRRYRKRWKIERTFAWLGNFRRLVVRYERKIQVYQGFFHLACLIITLRHL